MNAPRGQLQGSGSLDHVKALFRAQEGTHNAAIEAPADGTSNASASDGGGGDGSWTASPRPQHLALQPPAAQPHLGHLSLQLPHPGGLQQQHSLGLLDRLALQQRTRLQPGLPMRGGSKTFSCSSGYDSLADQEGVSPSGPGPSGPACSTLKYGAHVSARLQRRCSKARKMLGTLQQPVCSVADGGEKPPLPSAALRFCKGLAFVRQRKAGILGSWNWGSMMLLQRLPDGTWSAPVFLRLRYASVGITLGAQRMRSVHVLQSAEQVAALACDSAGVTWDITLPTEVDPYEMNAPIKSVKHKDLSLPPQTHQPHRAMITQGLMLDLSLRAGFTLVDDHLHNQLYPAGLTLEQILGGRVEPPAEFLPLYQDIEERAAEAQVVRPTVSKFELARKRSLQRATALSSRSSSLHKNSSVSLETPTQQTEVRGASPGSGNSQSLFWPASQDGSLCGGSPPTGSCGFTKLFADVDIGFVEEHKYEQQQHEGEEQEQHEGERQQQQQQEQEQQQQPQRAAPRNLLGGGGALERAAL